uniref:CULT domain-containing protein n=1 Tax=Caenorhabditis tropicalis TaxID=1561998 RepID=A0A1I7T0L7_9PELO
MNVIRPNGNEVETLENAEQNTPQENWNRWNRDNSHLFDYALENTETRESYQNQAHLQNYGTNWFPICKIGTVCFPEQQIPMKFSEDEQELYDRIIGSARANGFVVLFPMNIEECNTFPYIATLSKVVQSNPQTLSIELIGVHRCRALEHNAEETEALVQLLPEVEVTSKLSSHIPKFARNFPLFEKRELAFKITGYPFNFLRNITEKHVKECCEELESMIGEEAVRTAKSRGLVYFSYFASQNIFSDQNREYSLLKEDSANTRIAAALKYCKMSIAKCSICNVPIFRNDHIMRLPNQTMVHVNAHGYNHKITLVQQISNFRRMGFPSFDFTWFPEYAWIIIQCSRCGQHIGWEYVSRTQNPAQFFGIQREGIRFENDEEEIVSETIVNSSDSSDDQSGEE